MFYASSRMTIFVLLFVSLVRATKENENNGKSLDSATLPKDSQSGDVSLSQRNLDLRPVTANEISVKNTERMYNDNCPLRCPINTVAVKDQCFRFVQTSRFWNDAKKDCEEQGGYLAIPDLTNPKFALELSAVYRDIMGFTTIWIGATDQGSAVTWKWVNGQALSVNHPNWLPGHPGTYVFNNCAAISQFKRGILQIRKNSCTQYTHVYLCQFDPYTPTTNLPPLNNTIAALVRENNILLNTAIN